MRKIARRYQVEKQVQEQKLFTLSAVTDTKENKQVLAQELSAIALARPLESLLRYRKVTEKLQEVKHGNILEVIESGQEENTDFTIYEYCDSKPLTEYQHATLTEKIEFFLSAARGLEATHQAKILHGGLNPLSILVSDKVVKEEQKDTTTVPLYPTQQTLAGRHSTTASHIKLTGFGLNLLSDLTKINTPEEIRNVFGYLSPEGTGILRKPLDPRSDLYSLGIVFYELFSGQLPYISGEVTELIHQHIATTPVLPSAINPEIPVVIEKMIMRLIAKDPQDRYQSAAGLIYDLEEYQWRVANQLSTSEVEGRVPIDFEIARQDRLKELNFSTRLIGRDKELKSLKDNLKQAVTGRGSVSLVYGEAGVGKSRLVDELRTHVQMIKGIFIGGKCYQYEFRTPYKVISEAVGMYIEKVKRLSRQEQQAHIGLIKEALGELGGEAVKIAPNLKELIGEPSVLVELEPEKEKIRFLITVSEFIASLGSQENPLLLFLDDLQWVDEGSLEILERVIFKIKEKPCTLIISYRSNEVNENHILSKMLKKIGVSSSELVEKTENYQLGTPNHQLLSANFINNYPILPFNTTETAQLLSQILLEPIDNMLLLAEYLYERTQGNPFFTLELLRTLYEEKLITLSNNQRYAYDLNSLKQAVLPANVVDIVLKRVKGISPADKQVLSYASVMGKEIDLELLSKLTHKDLIELMNTVEGNINSQLLYRDLTGQEGVYFIHDRVRESFYGTLTPEEKIPLHKQIAESIEEKYRDNLEEVIYDLAYHYSQSQVENKALIYSIQGGDKARKTYSNELAIRLYETAKGILEKKARSDRGIETQRHKGDQENDSRYIDILENLGEVYRLTGRFEESLKNLKTCESLLPRAEILHRIRTMSKMGDTLWDNGDTRESAEILEEALKLLKVKVPKSKPAVFLGIGLQFTIQMLHWVLPKIFIKEKFVATEQQLVVVRILNRLGHTYYFIDINKSFYLLLRTLNRAEYLGLCQELAYAYVTIIPAWGVLLFRVRVERDFKKATALCQKIGDIVHEGGGYAYYACFGGLINNKPKEGLEYALKAINILKTRGEFWDLGVGYAFRDFNSWISGRLKEAVLENEEMINIMKSANALQPLGWSLFERGLLQAMIGDFYAGIIGDIKKSYEIMEITRDKPNMIMSQGILSFVHTRMKKYSEALPAADKVRKLFPTHYNKGPWCLEALPAGAQAYLDYIANTQDISTSQRKEYLQKSRWFIFTARFYSIPMMFPFFRGWMYQVWGTYNWLSGRKKRGEELWDKGLQWLRTNKGNPSGDKYRIACLLLEEAKFLLEDLTILRQKTAKGELFRQAQAGFKVSSKEQQRRITKAQTNLIEARDLFAEMGCVLDLETCKSLMEKITSAGVQPGSREALTAKRRFESLLNVIQAIGTIVNLEEVLDKIMEYVLRVTGAERGFLLLYDDKGSNLELKLTRGLETELSGLAFSYNNYKMSLGLIKEVEQTQKGIIVSVDDEGSIARELKANIERQAICVLLRTKEKGLGIIYLDNRLSGGMFGEDELELMEAFAVQASVSIENAKLYSDLKKAYLGTIYSFILAIESKDEYTHGHSERVQGYSIKIGIELGLSPKEIEILRYAALLHDIGKIGMPENILLKPGKLSKEEYDIVKKHPIIGYNIVKPLAMFSEMIQVIYYHHERFDGQGYPEGLKGEKIPLLARITAVADSFDAMTSKRPYRDSLSFAQAYKEVMLNSGTQFCPKVITAFEKSCKSGGIQEILETRT